MQPNDRPIARGDGPAVGGLWVPGWLPAAYRHGDEGLVESEPAGITNRHFADDIPVGQPLRCHPARLRATPRHPFPPETAGKGRPIIALRDRAGPCPHPDVAVAQVRRVAFDPAGRPLEPAADATGAFSEMALYVLVRRDRTWWVAAGQNTLIRPGPPDSQAHEAGPF
jgi:hypothetical protein